MNKRRWITYCILTLILILNYAIAPVNAGIGELKKKQSNTKQEMNQQQKKIKELEGQTKDVSAQIEKLDKEMARAISELEKVEGEIEILNKDIEKTMSELKKAEDSIAEKQDVFNSRLRVMYKNGNMGYLEVLLTSEGIGDFLVRKEMLQSIANHDVELLEHMREQRDIIDKKNTELKSQRASKEVARSKLDNRKEDLSRASRAKESFMADLNEDLERAEKEYAILERESKDIAAEIVRKQRLDIPYSGSNNSQGGSGGGSYGGSMTWPVPGHTRISSSFGWRVHPVHGGSRLHAGIDIPAPAGTNVIAVADGIVMDARYMTGYGNTIGIDHGGGISTRYAHNSSLVVGVGTRVTKGTVIAKVGSTGISTGNHCHFEVRKNGQPIDPIPWLRNN